MLVLATDPDKFFYKQASKQAKPCRNDLGACSTFLASQQKDPDSLPGSIFRAGQDREKMLIDTLFGSTIRSNSAELDGSVICVGYNPFPAFAQ